MSQTLPALSPDMIRSQVPTIFFEVSGQIIDVFCRAHEKS